MYILEAIGYFIGAILAIVLVVGIFKGMIDAFKDCPVEEIKDIESIWIEEVNKDIKRKEDEK